MNEKFVPATARLINSARHPNMTELALRFPESWRSTKVLAPRLQNPGRRSRRKTTLFAAPIWNSITHRIKPASRDSMLSTVPPLKDMSTLLQNWMPQAAIPPRAATVARNHRPGRFTRFSTFFSP